MLLAKTKSSVLCVPCKGIHKIRTQRYTGIYLYLICLFKEGNVYLPRFNGLKIHVDNICFMLVAFCLHCHIVNLACAGDEIFTISWRDILGMHAPIGNSFGGAFIVTEMLTILKWVAWKDQMSPSLVVTLTDSLNSLSQSGYIQSRCIYSLSAILLKRCSLDV